MDNPVILKKLESLHHCLSRIESKRPKTLGELQNNVDLQDILSVNLERAVQISVDIAAIMIAETNALTADSMAQSFLVLEREKIIPLPLAEKLRNAVGFRNISVHEYQDIDWALVFDIIHNHLSTFSQFIDCILAQ